MLKPFVFLLYIAVLITHAASWFLSDAHRYQNVIEANDEDFNYIMPEFDTAMVLFYVPWCPHCQHFMPEFENAASKLVRNDPPVAAVKVDCSGAGKDTCDHAHIDGYPTVKIFRQGNYVKPYDGPREAQAVVQFMRNQIGSASTEIQTKNGLPFAGDAITVVGLLRRNTGSKEEFMLAAEALRNDAKFFHCLDDSSNETVTVFRPVYLHNKFEEGNVTYQGDCTASEIKRFISNNMHGLVGRRTTTNKSSFQEPLVVAYYNVDYYRNQKQTNYWRNRILKVAEQFKGNVSFAISDWDDCADELMDDFGVSRINSDPTPLITARKGDKFLMRYKFSLDALESFVGELLEGKLEPFAKSQAVPEPNNDTVSIAVAENFDKVVRNRPGDVLLLVYSPVCPRCRQVMPQFERLAEELKNEDVAFVKIDGTSNDVPAEFFDFEQYPGLYLVYKNGNKKYEEEELTLDELRNFVARFSTIELKGLTRSGVAKKERESAKTEL